MKQQTIGGFFRQGRFGSGTLSGVLTASVLLCAPVLAQNPQENAQNAPGGAAQGTPGGAAAGDGAVPLAITQTPDVVVIAFPFPGGQWMLSTVYSQKVERGTAEKRVKDWEARTGWAAGNLEFENRALDQVGNDFGVKAPVMSSLSFSTNGALVGSDGTVALEPFLLAFRDLETVHVVFATPQGFDYKGVRDFESDQVSVSCFAGQGSVSCQTKIKDHNAQSFDLPRFAPADGSVAEASGKNKGWFPLNPVTAVFALVAALAAGFGVFVLTRRAVNR
ncbi:MAG: hypothetical protein OHK0029_37810 [Armatimonadaceae bacterium]